MKKNLSIALALLAFGVASEAQNSEKVASRRVLTESDVKAVVPLRPMNSKFGRELQQHLGSQGVQGQGPLTQTWVKATCPCDPPAKQPCVSVMVRLLPSAGVTAEVLEGAGCTVNWAMKSQAFVTVPLDKLDALAELDGVLGVDLPQTAQLNNAVAREVTHVSTVADPVSALAAGLPKEYDGSGVIVGVVDAGIDFGHPAFRNEDGTTRIKRAFTYHRSDDVQPGESVSNWESVYSDPEEILNVPPVTNYTHGSHTTATAAGSNTGNNMQGMAPGADLVVADLAKISKDYLIYGLANICEYADEVGKPVVTNYSIGAAGGFRDGCDYTSQAFVELTNNGTKPGVVFSVSAGNSGDYQNYVHHTFTHDDEKFYVMMDIPSEVTELSTTTPGEMLRVHELNDEESISAFIDRDVPITEEMLVAFSLDEKRLLNADELIGVADLYIEKIEGEDYYFLTKKDGREYEGLKYITLGVLRTLLRNDYSYGLERHTCSDGVTTKWQYEFETNKDMTIMLLEDVRLGAYLSLPAGTQVSVRNLANNRGGKFINPEGFEDLPTGTPEGSVDDNVCNEACLAVGSYNVRDSYTNFFGDNIDFSDEDPTGQVSVFTSYGYTDDGNHLAKPDVLAPGSYLLSAVNGNYAPYFESYGNPLPKDKMESSEYLVQKLEYEGKNYWYEYMQGTSMAAPTVTGIVALWLQADPTLSVRDVLDVIAKTSKPVATSNPLQAGHGLIDALAGLKYILSERVGIDNVSFPQPADKRIFTLDGREVKGTPSRGIYVTSGRKVVR